MAQILDWIAQSYEALSGPLNASRCVNFFAEIEVQDALSKTPVPVWGCPGIASFATVGSGPIKAFNVMNDVLYVVSGQELYQLNRDGTSSLLGAWLLQDMVSIDNNGVQIVAVDGYTGWVYQPGGITQSVAADGAVGDTSLSVALVGTIANGATLTITLDNGAPFTTTTTATVGPNTVSIPLAAPLPSSVSVGNVVVAPATTIAQITDPNFFPARTVTFFDGYFCFDRKGTKEFFLSPLYGIVPFDGSLFASKESTSDLLLATANSHEQLYLFGERRIEVWFDAGNAPPTFPFQRSDGALIQRGCGAPYSVVLEDNTLFFLGEDGMFYRVDGYVPVRISNHAVETQWQSYGDISDAFAFIYTLFGHKLLTITFPSVPITWVLDLATQRWHERESWVGSSADDSIGKWRVSCALNWWGKILVGDSQSAQVGQLNTSVYTEWGDTMRGLLVGPPIASDRRRIFMRRFELDVESGVGLQPTVTVVPPYTQQPVQIVAPSSLANGTGLVDVGRSFTTAALSCWVYLPDDGNFDGFWWSNQTDDASPGTPGLQIGIFNDQSSPTGMQVAVNGWDTNGAAVLAASGPFTAWSGWVWFGVSLDTYSNRLQVWYNAGAGDAQLALESVVWSSPNAIGNPAANGWHLVPSIGPIGLVNNGGVVQLIAQGNYPTSPTGLSPGDVWSNGLVVMVVPGGSAGPATLYFGRINAAQLLAVGGGGLPTVAPAPGTNLLWVNGGVLAVAPPPEITDQFGTPLTDDYGVPFTEA